jgi:hypothetical protein
MAEVVVYLPIKHKGLNSNPDTAKKKSAYGQHGGDRGKTYLPVSELEDRIVDITQSEQWKIY